MGSSRMSQLQEYRGWVAHAQQRSGKGAIRQLGEIRSLRRLGGRCGVSDYYWYRLYDEGYQKGRGAVDYLGWRLRPAFSEALNPRQAVLPAWDKLSFHALADAAGLPLAPIAATYHRAQSISKSLGRHLKSVDEVRQFLREPGIYPLFVKPSYSQQGIGAVAVDGYHAPSDSVILPGAGAVPMNRFLQQLTESVDKRFHRPACGCLFQPRLFVHPAIQALTQWNAVCGARVVCLNGPDGVQCIRAIWKVALPPNTVDNFSRGEWGNLVADIDIATGEVRDAVAGLSPVRVPTAAQTEMMARIQGFRLPDWDRVLDICKAAGPVFPLMQVHHWDFALTDRGPLILEINDIVDTEVLQLHGRGLLTESTRAFLRAHGDRQAHPWVAQL
jgi:hypothetical protein